MGHTFIRLTLAIVMTSVLGFQAQAYYGRNSTEATLNFTGRIELDLPGVTQLNLDDLNNLSGETGAKVHTQLNNQVKHLMGFFLSRYMKEDLGFPFVGILGETWTAQFFRFVRREGAETWVADYQFNGKVIFHKDAFRSETKRDVPIIMPLFPQKIYKLSLKDGTSSCVAKEDASEAKDDFWYDWDLHYPGCNLRDDSRNLIRTSGTIEILPSTTSTYPDYSRLYGNNFNGNTLQIASFFGYIGNTSIHHANRRDDSYKAMNILSKHLVELGYEQTSVMANFRMYRDGRIFHDGSNILRVYEKQDVLAGGRHISVRVQLLLADSDSESTDVTFQRYFEQALTTADVIHYDGHSGLGAYLDVARFPNVQWNPEKYQAIYFNACSSYPYFNGAFISAKGGKNLNVVTSGTATLTDSSAPNAIAFLDPFLQGHLASWQKILGSIETSNGEDGTYLNGVSGDENNEWHPQ